jgi:hypothetical protein
MRQAKDTVLPCLALQLYFALSSFLLALYSITRTPYVEGRDSVVGIVTSYWLDFFGKGFIMGARFSAPVHTGPGAQPVSSSMGTESLSRG